MSSTDRSSEPAAGVAGRLPAWLRWILPAALFVVALLPFLPALSFGFVEYDDDRNLFSRYNPYFNEQSHALDGPTLRWMISASHFGHYQPLTWLSYAVDAALSGRFDARDFHRTNLLLHGLNAVLVYALAGVLLRAALRLQAPSRPSDGQEGRDLRPQADAAGEGRSTSPAGTQRGSAAMLGLRAPDRAELPLALSAATTSLLYALHPLRVESVAWITERRDVLSGAFLLLALLSYVRFATRRGGQRLWFVLSLLCYAASLFSKAWGITLPLVLLLLDLYPLRRREGPAPATWLQLVGEKLLYLPFALIFARLAAGAQALVTLPLEAYGPLDRLAQACYGLVFYLVKTVWPVSLSPLYLLEADFDATRPLHLACITLVALAAVALVRLRGRLPGLVAAAGAYAILVSPVLGFLQSGPQKVADRYTYLAAIPLSLLAGGLALRWMMAPAARATAQRMALATALGLIVSTVLGVLARVQTLVWRDTESVYRQVIAVEPDNYFALHCLSVLVGRRPQSLEEALGYARASVAAYGGLGNLEARRNLANLLSALGREEEADAQLREAVALAPDWLPGLQQLVSRRLSAGAAEEALALVESSLARAPRFVDGYAELARIQFARGRPDLAQQAWERGLELDPRWPIGNYSVGYSALEAGDPVRAEAHFLRALEQGAVNADLLLELGRAYQAQGRLQEAGASYRRALALEPENARAQALLESLGPAAGR